MGNLISYSDLINQTVGQGLYSIYIYWGSLLITFFAFFKFENCMLFFLFQTPKQTKQTKSITAQDKSLWEILHYIVYIFFSFQNILYFHE